MDTSDAAAVRALLHHLLDALDAAVARQRARGRPPDADLLGGLVVEPGELPGLVAAVRHDLRAPAPPPPALALDGELGRVTERFALDGTHQLALALALGVELDPRIARVVGYLNDHAGRIRPTLGLVWEVALVPLAARPGWTAAPVVADGLLRVAGDGPLSSRELTLDPGVAERLVAGAVPPPRVPDLDALVLTDDVRERVRAWAAGPVSLPLRIEGAPGTGRRTLARAALALRGLGAVVGSDPVALRRDARWFAAGAVAEGAVGDWPEAVPLVQIAAAGERPALPGEPAAIRLDTPPPSDRARLWRRSAVGPHLGDAEVDEIATRFPFGAGRIHRAAARAAAGAWRPGLALQTCREAAASSLGALATRLSCGWTRDDLVVPEALTRELDLLLAWVRHRHRVLDQTGLGRRVPNGWGVAALLAGPPGTGKTMAAQIVARELDADLYRVDLARVVSKFVGETEKKLAALLDEATSAGAVLLFDEADALFGRRSEVRDAHDRYANQEVGFLLQRLEDHQGVILLSSNRATDLDEAFQRRFQFVLPFALPDAALRARIWTSLLREVPHGALDVGELAERFPVSGGEIRNAVLAAAFLAAGDGARLERQHLLAALRREITKSGRVLRRAEREVLDE
ncbi:MAG: ATP-binding protein [Myxococcota bacterium]